MLSDMAVRSAKGRERDYKLSDGGGLHLLVKPSGSRLWRLAYRFAGKQKSLSIGPYPTVGLADARTEREKAKRTLKEGLDPSRKKRLDKIEAHTKTNNTFKLVAEELIVRYQAEGAAERTIDKTRWLLELAYPSLGGLPISEITAADIYRVLRRIEKSGRLESARRLRSVVGRVFRYAIVTARATQDPSITLIGATLAPKITHHAAIFEPKKLGELMRAIRGYDGNQSTRVAMQLMALTFPRSEELRYAEVDQFDLGEAALWSIPAARTKMGRPHLVPLARQTIDLLRPLLEDRNPRHKLLFPSVRSWLRPISENTVNAALRRMGYSSDEMTGHGFRRTASTALNEHGFDSDHIERQLAHKDMNRIREAYNAAEFLDQRREMMQWWADRLDLLAVDEDDLIG